MPDPPAKPPRFVLTLALMPDAPGAEPFPVEQRLRRLLKYALRACRLRCVSATEETPLAEGDPDDDRHET